MVASQSVDLCGPLVTCSAIALLAVKSSITAERACAKEQAARAQDPLKVKLGQDAPAHQLKVEVDGLFRESAHAVSGLAHK